MFSDLPIFQPMASRGITDPPTHPPIPWPGLARQARAEGVQTLQTLFVQLFPWFYYWESVNPPAALTQCPVGVVSPILTRYILGTGGETMP